MCHVFAVCIDEIKESSYQEIYHRMPLDRQIRTDQYRHQTDRMRSVAAYCALEKALQQSCHLEHIPDGIQICYSTSGKPYLKDFKEFYFSLSHSGNYAICAVDLEGSIGADILKVRKADMRIAERFFAKAEIDQLKRLQGKERDLTFSRIWTRKESYVKFTGEGLKRDLSEFMMDQDSKQLVLNDRPQPVWFLEIEEPEGYVIAVCGNTESGKSLHYQKVRMK